MVAVVVKVVLFTLILCTSCLVNVILASTWDMATPFQVAPPEPFNFSRPNEWTKWIRWFEGYKSASGLEEKSPEAQVNTLIYTMGAEADDIFQSFDLSDEDKRSMQQLKPSLSCTLWSAGTLSMNVPCLINASKRKVRRWIHLSPHFIHCLNTVSMALPEKRQNCCRNQGCCSFVEAPVDGNVDVG